MGEMKRVVVLVFIAAATMQAAAPPQFTLKVGVDVVNVLFTVVDRVGRLIPGLTRQDFLVEEDGKKQDIRYFSRENELPVTMGLLIDTSPSVRLVFNEERAAAVRFLESILRPGDLALVIGFEKSVTLVQDYTENRRMLRRAIDELEIGPAINGGTSLYDAVYLVAREKLGREAGRKAIVLISDGQDTTSKVEEQKAIIAVHASNAVIYSMAIGTHSRGVFPRLGAGDPRTLKRLSEETGGGFFPISDERDFDRAFHRIEQELRSQYSLGYVSTNSARDGTYRRIRIIPRDPGYKITARRGYYAAKNPENH
jgi:VWFA-related protein